MVVVAVLVAAVVDFVDQTAPSSHYWTVARSLLKQTGMAGSPCKRATEEDSALVEYRLVLSSLLGAMGPQAETATVCRRTSGELETLSLV